MQTQESGEGHAGTLPLVTFDEATSLLRVSRAYLHRLVRAGDLRVVKLGRRTLVDRADLDDLIERRKRGGPAAE
jgi:excisionase family DNA binding protein